MYIPAFSLRRFTASANLAVFVVHRFKQNLSVQFNGRFGEELLATIRGEENLPKWLYAFRQKLAQRLAENDQNVHLTLDINEEFGRDFLVVLDRPDFLSPTIHAFRSALDEKLNDRWYAEAV